jgi:putative ABC transport system ATP-binding protein
VINGTTAPKNAVTVALLCKIYEAFGSKIEVLKDIDMKIRDGEFAVVSGPSGSGKTTLLNMIGAIDKPTSGKVLVFGEDLAEKNEDFLAGFRCAKIGHVFQSYNLVSTLTVMENLAFPMEWLRKPNDEIKNRVRTLLEMVGLQNRAEHFPFQLSGGEQQRVAFARALANEPPMMLIDEPTGNLDRKTSTQIVQILQTLKDRKRTVITATHDPKIIELGDQRLLLEDARLMSRNE